MLTNVPTATGALVRSIVCNHPNSFTAEVYRMIRERVDEPDGPDASTFGGMGVLDKDDDPEIEFKFLGYAYVLPAEQFAPSRQMDANDAAQFAEEYRFLIEPAAPSGHSYWFDIRDHDVVYLLIGEGGKENPAKLAFEVIGRETTTNIPPYNTRYIMNRRDDLHVDKSGNYISDKIQNTP